MGISTPPANAEKETISWSPRKYQGAFAGFSGTSGLAISFNGASRKKESATVTAIVNMKTAASAVMR